MIKGNERTVWKVSVICLVQKLTGMVLERVLLWRRRISCIPARCKVSCSVMCENGSRQAGMWIYMQVFYYRNKGNKTVVFSIVVFDEMYLHLHRVVAVS